MKTADWLGAARLDATKLAAIDREIAAMSALPKPWQVRDALRSLANAIPGATIDFPQAVKLLAIHHRCSAGKAQAKLFAAVEAGDLEVEFLPC